VPCQPLARSTNALVQKACQQAQQHVIGLHALVPDDDLSFLG
jgi:hypothetical protein